MFEYVETAGDAPVEVPVVRLVGQEEFEERAETCRSCDRFKDNRCSLTGRCLRQAIYADLDCPEGLWKKPPAPP